MKEPIPQVPHARKKGLIIEELSDEVLIYDLDRHQAHCLNHSATLVWQSCNGKMTVAEITYKLKRELQMSVDEDVIWVALDQLGKFNLLQGRLKRPPDAARISRRALMRKLGIAATVIVPLVTTIIAPTSAQAATCLSSGSICNDSSQCCSTVCDTSVTPSVCT